ncbi:MAG: HlyD family efflux transporter periplasmic adaptor subunit [Planctomycetota bacterium]|nr:HlyD family efflux transporter periplasmic adaptor subunit [Planctomycetota bacterium]
MPIGRLRKRSVLITAVCGAAVSAIALLLVFGGGRERPCATVRRGSIEISIRRRGVLVPADEAAVPAPFGGFLTEVVPFGATVKPGDILFSIDARHLENALRWRRYSLARADANLANVESAGERAIRAAENEIERCRLRLQLERLRFDETVKGPKPEDELLAKVRLQASENMLKARRQEYEILKSLADMGFVSGEEVRTKDLQVKEAEVERERCEIAWKRMHAGPEASKTEEQELRIRDAERMLDNAGARLESARKAHEAAVAQAKRQKRFHERASREISDKIAKARAAAPAEGKAIVHSHWGSPWSAGRWVHEGAKVVSIPRTRGMKAVATVDEGNMHALAIGQEARVRAEAFPGHVLRGRVARIAELGKDEFESFLPETRDRVGEAMRKAYDVEIELPDDAPIPLSPNMTVSVEILVRSVEGACLVPRMAVLGNAAEGFYVEVPRRFGAARVPVRVPAATRTLCAVEGVGEGERVLLPVGEDGP